MARVLIADDEVAYLDAFCEGMEALGHDPTAVTHRDQLLERLQAARYDIVFLDVVMAGGGAITLIHEVGKLDPDLPVVIITGRPELIGSPLFREGLRAARAKVHKATPLAHLDQLVRRHARARREARGRTG
ncbi:response regulator [Albimonas pacifica]|uniref:Response regulator receiver domain-containing protein n=1 Tax=Albimonas pacifica TaxID=1114924 RepID=A0A1I3MZS7_9RHOB|nr:response regulator [Albimonas pacifica]SFJ02260.1 Response regulator receiver domain-containing protein [Albimonas pacifica]